MDRSAFKNSVFSTKTEQFFLEAHFNLSSVINHIINYLNYIILSIFFASIVIELKSYLNSHIQKTTCIVFI